ncbi:unnamed protein product [Caenorhabditis angaria]|uniref:Uncharacterized protein n=1 Tax=Caenorhabditis angaria TaxID=860376 RepID=A0A9P1J3V5_9PELO|nr:unnamed protein product [Caenorhabditis angaria]
MSNETDDYFYYDDSTNSSFTLQRCYENLLTSSQLDTAKYLMYFSGGWIILWCLITTLVNICHKNSGHHRFIHFFQELGIIFLAVFMCILNFALDRNYDLCKYVVIGNDFLMCFVCSLFLMEAFFASSMVNGKSDKNGGCPVVIYYILPIIIAAIPTVASYFPEKDYYGTSGLHCFVISTVDMFWAFVIPVWTILSAAILKSQLSCISCDRQNDSQNEDQVYWSRRSAKSLTIISLMLFSVWMMVMLAAEHQRLYLFILTTVLVIFFGPTIFIIHTFGHLNTCRKWASPGCFGNFYTMCPPKEKPERSRKYSKLDDDDDDIDPVKNNQDPEKSESPPRQNQVADSSQPSSKSPPQQKAPSEQHTKSSKFYSWLTDNGGAQSSKDVLFTPTLY